MKFLERLTSYKNAAVFKVLTILSQIAIVVLAVVLVINMTTRQYASNQVESIRLEFLDQIQAERKVNAEKFRLLKDELVSYQNTREARAQLFAQRVDNEQLEREKAVERLNRRVDNLNTKINYWNGKVKRIELEEKLKKQ